MLRRIMAGTAAAAGAVLLAASPASAAQNIYVATSDPFDGGTAQFLAYGERFSVCDNRSDGKRAVAHWLAFTSTQTRAGTLQDANGSGNECVSTDESFPEGVKVTLRVCLKDGPDGREEYCQTREGQA